MGGLTLAMAGLGCLQISIQALGLGLMLIVLLVSIRGLFFHPWDVPPFIFPRNGAPIASGFVPYATASVASSLGGTVA
jgi:hypothetical protein